MARAAAERAGNGALADLLEEIGVCRLCRDTPRFGAPLPHEPRPVLRVSRAARLCVAGQAPGTRVHASGTPFTDPSGERLRAWMGVREEEFYDESRVAIVPMGLCFPGLDARGGDLPPRRECAEHWHQRIFAELPGLELLLTIGQYAQSWHLGQRRHKNLTETVRAWRDYARDGEGLAVIPLPHPSWRNTAWLKRNPWFEAELVPELRARVRAIMDEGEGA